MPPVENRQGLCRREIAVSEPKPAVLAPTKAQLVLQSGHSSGVLSVKFSPDGKILVTRSLGEAILWDTHTGLELRTLAAASTDSSMAFSADGKVLATAVAGAVIFWDPITGKKLRTIDGPNDVALSSTAFSPDGKYLAAGQDNRSVECWDVASGRMLHRFSNVEVIRPRVAFSPDSKQLAIGLTDVILYDVLTGEKVRTFDVGALDRRRGFQPRWRQPGGSVRWPPLPQCMGSQDGPQVALRSRYR